MGGWNTHPELHTTVQKDYDINIIISILSFGVCYLDIIISVQTTTELFNTQIKFKDYI